MGSPLRTVKEEDQSGASVFVDLSDAMDIDIKDEDETSTVASPLSQSNILSIRSTNPFANLDETELADAVLGKKPGRKIGSGANKKRKAPNDYSDNKHTKKARSRVENMTLAQQELNRAKNRERQNFYRKINNVKGQKWYKDMSTDEQKAYAEELKARLKVIQKMIPDSSTNLRRHMMDSLEASLAAKIQKLKLEDQDVATLRRLGFSPDHGVYWGDDDDDEIPVTARMRKTTSKKDIDDADFGERLDQYRTSREPADEFLDQGFSCKDLKWADGPTLDLIYNKVQQKSLGLARKRINQAIFTAYKEDLLDRADIYTKGLRVIDRVCINGKAQDAELRVVTDIFVTKRMRAFLVALAHLSSERPHKLLQGVFQDGEGIMQADGTTRKPLPNELDETGWYNLPGPATLWPDSKIWYERNDLEVDPEDTAGTLKAVKLMQTGHWVDGWVPAMIRGDALQPDYSICWI